MATKHYTSRGIKAKLPPGEVSQTNGRKYGRFIDSIDHRDKYIGMAGEVKSDLPKDYSLQEWLGAVKDQGDLGSCTGNAFAGIREYLHNRFHQYDEKQPIFGKPAALSPLFLYYKEREMEGTLEMGDTGAESRTGCQVLNKVGVCQEWEELYDTKQYQAKPSERALQDAGRFKIGAYHRVLDIVALKSCIVSGYPVAIGFDVFDSFESDRVAETGVMPMPNTGTEQLLGGHEVYAFGYSDSINGGSLFVRNSWGLGWGIDGNFWMPYDVINSGMASDLWMAHLGKPWKPKK